MILGDMSWTQGPYTTHPHTRIITHLVSLNKNVTGFADFAPPLGEKYSKGNYSPNSINGVKYIYNIF